MKKYSSLILFIIMLLTACLVLSACSLNLGIKKKEDASENAYTSADAKPDTEGVEESVVIPETWLDPESEEYGRVSVMFDSAALMSEYRQISYSYLNMEELADEDFWNLFALAVAGFHTEDMVDSVGVYHISESMEYPEYMDAFMSEALEYRDAPSIRTSKYVSKDPGTDVIDIIPITVSNLVPVLHHIDKVYDGRYEMCIHLTGDVIEGYEETYIWNTVICEWEDDMEHLIPFVVKKISYVNTLETAPEDTSLSSDSAISSESAVEE